MATDVDFEIIRAAQEGDSRASVRVRSIDGRVVLTIACEMQSMLVTLLPSEAVTIGEQLIAAGKAGEV
nr:hypothetical protein [Stenotrophomonas maltophilia]